MIEIQQVKFSKAELRSAPEDERLFHLLTGQLANDINYLTKIISLAFNPTPDPLVRHRANISLATFAIKILAGRLTEGRKLLRHSRFRQIFNKYAFSDKASENLAKIDRYFAVKSNSLLKVRNQFAFHADTGAMQKGFEALPDDYLLSDYHSEFPAHRLYYSSELVTVIAMAKTLNSDDWQQSLDQMAREAAEVALWFGEFISEFMEQFRKKYIQGVHEEAEYETISIEDAPAANSIWFPFFCEPPLR